MPERVCTIWGHNWHDHRLPFMYTRLWLNLPHCSCPTCVSIGYPVLPRDLAFFSILLAPAFSSPLATRISRFAKTTLFINNSAALACQIGQSKTHPEARTGGAIFGRVA
ncbi:hypothetical protein Ciccas_001480 [Cichlidogyrus casuarinus]|uniref:Uncharacterized protein n=1 Tax=Cichlidogyrus casuarinus TaxID=1844966 RepID=A0ABD2QK02_9PLAT